jgi:L-fuculose-phosphate aldolase
VETTQFMVAAAARILARAGCESMVGGHLSARAAHPDEFWVTTSSEFSRVVPASVARVSMDLDLLAGDVRPNGAVAFHADIYRARPDVGAVVHTHSWYAGVLSSTGHTVGMYKTNAAMLFGEQACHVDDGFDESRSGPAITRSLGDRQVLLLKNHGVVAVGSSIEDATVLALTVEETARFQLECEAIGGTPLSDDYARDAKPHLDAYRPRLWERYLRAVRISDADLFEDEGA